MMRLHGWWLIVLCTAPVVDDGANEYVEYTFPFFDLDPGEEKWNNKPTYEMDVRWFESYSEFRRTENWHPASVILSTDE